MEVSLREWTLNDLENLQKYANNKNISDNLADAFPHPYTKQDGITFIEKVTRQNPTKVFAIEVNNNAIGSIGIFPDSDIHRKNAAIAYWIAEPFWGKGIASKAIHLMLEYSFEKFDLERVYAKPFGNNQNSHRVLTKAGFRLEATLQNAIFKNGSYVDELIYSITKQNVNSR